MIPIDGRLGEGGGQVLRTSLALSAITGQPVHLHHIRAGRSKPGLMRQHLTCVRAAVAVCGAQVRGDAMRSSQVVFHPGAIQPGEHHFAVGSAGSAALVLQTVLPILLCASGPSVVRVQGGTHAMWAPPFPFVAGSFVPALTRMGLQVQVSLITPGFYPAGGGELLAEIQPGRPEPVELHARGPLELDAHAIVSGLGPRIGWTELKTLRSELDLGRHDPPLQVDNPVGPGNACWITARYDGGGAVFTGFGRKGVRARQVALEAVRAFRTWQSAHVPVCEHLADQLLLPLALAGGGSLRTTEPTPHTRTNAQVIEAFTGQRFTFEDEGGGAWRVGV